MEVDPSVSLHPLFRMLQSDYPDLLEQAVEERLTLCLPDVRNIKDVTLDATFFCQHILHEDESGYYSSGDDSVVVEKNTDELRLVSCPGYHPSYTRGLYSTNILASTSSTNRSSIKCLENTEEDKLYVLLVDRPLVPSYYMMGNRQLGTMSGRQRRRLYKQQSVTSEDQVVVSSSSTFPKSRPSSAFYSRASSSGTTRTRVSSADSINKVKLTKQNSVTEVSKHADGVRNSPPRQVSADSGIEPDFGDNIYDLPAKITSYDESEAWIMDQIHHKQFLSHLHRLFAPVNIKLEHLTRSISTITEDDITSLIPTIKLLIQDSLISFPKSSTSISRSPRYQEMLRTSVENVILQFVHQQLWPLIQHLHKDRDKSTHRHLSMLWKRGFTVLTLGVEEEWSVPFPAALVELAALDMRSTPLDKLTLIHDTIDQIRTQENEVMLDSNHLGEDDHQISREESILSGVLVQARPLFLHSAIFYIKHFVFSHHPELTLSMETLVKSLSKLENIDGRKLRGSSAKMKREYSLEDLIDLTDEIEQRYDRHGVVRDTELQLSLIDVFREKLAKRLELSSNEMTRHQEEAWSRLAADTPTPAPPTTAGSSSSFSANFLHNLQSKLICSTKQ